MKAARLLALVLVPMIPGCDIALGVYFATRGSSSSKKSSAAAAPDVRFFVWVADLSGTTGAAEQGLIAGANGNPGLNWTLLGSGTTSMELTMPPGNFDSVLIQATDAQIYHIDAIELLDATGTTTSTVAPGTLFGNLVNQTTRIEGPPDALVADTAATATDRAFVFVRRPAFITVPFRISIWTPTARAEGDLEWTSTYALGGNQLAGGAATNSAGMTYLTLRELNSILMLRFNASGAVVQDSGSNDFSTIASPVTTALGHSSVAIDQTNDDVFVASTAAAGDIRIQRWVGISGSAAWTSTPVSSGGVDRVETNSLALESTGDLVVAGGADFGGLNGVGHYLRRFRSSNGGDAWSTSTTPSPPVDTNGAPTYWHAVATFGANDIFTAGNLSATLGVGDVDIYTARTLDNSQTTSTVAETWNERVPSAPSTMAIGRSVGVDAGGTAYVGGFYTRADLDSVILRYGSGNPPATFHVNSTRTGNDEILDLAVESDGTIYAVGYETNGVQAQDFVLVKFAPNNQVVWKRTVHGGVGDDRAVSVVLTPLHVIVVGELTVGAGNKDIHVRKYVK